MMNIANTATAIVARAMAAKVELIDGPIGSHVGCAYDCWVANRRQLADTRARRETEIRVMCYLNNAGFQW